LEYGISHLLEFESEGIGMAPRKLELESMSLDELWSLHEELSETLSARIKAEKRRLEER